MMKQTNRDLATAIPMFALVLLASNLRPAITSVGPLLEDIRLGVGLSVTSAGLLSSLPLLAFALFSPLAHFGQRLGLERTLVLSMLLVVIGVWTRSSGSAVALFGGTVLLAAGIAVGNVLIPSVIKRDYPNRVQNATTIYAMTLGLSAAMSSGLAVPLARWLPGGWQSSLAVWSIPALVAVLVWLAPAWRTAGAKKIMRSPRTSVWRSSLAWKITAFMGLQSMAFYIVVSWFPAILRDIGYSAENAGFLLTMFQLIALVVGIVLPRLLKLARDQRPIVFVASLTMTVAVLGLIFFPNAGAFWVLLMGFGSGICFVLSLAFIGLRSADHLRAASLSMMSQSIGYLVASTGPVIFGWMHDLSDGWRVPLAVLVVVTLFQAAFGLSAGRNRTV